MKIMVFDDNATHRATAINQLKEHELTVVGTYAEAQRALTGHNNFDVVLTDLLVPANSFDEEELPLGTIIALLALKVGVKMVAVVTDANHHSNDASAALDVFRQETFVIGDAKMVCANYNVCADFDMETFRKVDFSFLQSPAGKEKYPCEMEENGCIGRKGIVTAKDWAKVLHSLIN